MPPAESTTSNAKAWATKENFRATASHGATHGCSDADGTSNFQSVLVSCGDHNDTITANLTIHTSSGKKTETLPTGGQLNSNFLSCGSGATRSPDTERRCEMNKRSLTNNTPSPSLPRSPRLPHWCAAVFQLLPFLLAIALTSCERRPLEVVLEPSKWYSSPRPAS